MIYRCILPDYAKADNPSLPKVVEGQFTNEEISQLNESCYNIYFLPNYPSLYEEGATVDGSQVDVFEYVFADMDLKDGVYPDKDSFLSALGDAGILPTRVVDSGNGVHAYWRVSDLDALSFLRLQRRIIRKFRTDEAVAKIYQLMRVPGTLNTKDPVNFKPCELLFETEVVYTCEELDKALPPLTREDEQYCKGHYDKTYNKERKELKVVDQLPVKFGELLAKNNEVRDIWEGKSDDRSKSDYRLGHVMFGNGFTKEEATSVLVNTQKARDRAPIHRLSYAEGIVEKIWTFELEPQKAALTLSRSVKDILSASPSSLHGERFPCHTWIDDTEIGFRLGHVIGLVAGAGVGKTAMALNMFMGFVQNNPNYHHFFVPLEQKAEEIAARWKTMCGDRVDLYEKVQILENYDQIGTYRNLSLQDIRDYILRWQTETKNKVGCVVIDHIGVLRKSSKDGRQSIEDICHEMKSVAVATNTLLVMQSQAPREKAGIGDLELNKDAAYGTVFFESYVDYLVTIWQPLMRCYDSPACPTVTAYKFCKIRHKKHGADNTVENVPYLRYFDPKTELFRELTQEELKSFDFFNKGSTQRRKRDRKTDLVSYKSTPWTVKPGRPGESNGKADHNSDVKPASGADGVSEASGN